ncbi:SCP2 sterol-binding domain-containing protein [Zoogloea sp.]|uniref:ubiquinone biosynthesis accessory factor UbiJ n=1 Tax=Zoogloea sp. TaxID=49181 RepID=UPI00262FC1D3|nr:SCP2 sterol-binding domain-containing protein [Zoogloea sp.]MDD3352470.1 hypothetical protein [Zoogloea sp.]
MMLTSATIVSLNSLLADAPWARQKLMPFAGRNAMLSLEPLNIGLGIDGDGYFTEAAGSEADVQLVLPLASLPKLLSGPDALMADIRISGNADFADALGFVLRKLRWDGEEALSRIIGDIAARRAVLTGRSLVHWHLQGARSVVENLSEYLSEEQPLLVKRNALEDLAGAVADLRDDLARLEKRLGKLKNH